MIAPDTQKPSSQPADPASGMMSPCCTTFMTSMAHDNFSTFFTDLKSHIPAPTTDGTFNPGWSCRPPKNQHCTAPSHGIWVGKPPQIPAACLRFPWTCISFICLLCTDGWVMFFNFILGSLYVSNRIFEITLVEKGPHWEWKRKYLRVYIQKPWLKACLCQICILFICTAHGCQSDPPLIALNDEDMCLPHTVDGCCIMIWLMEEVRNQLSLQIYFVKYTVCWLCQLQCCL